MINHALDNTRDDIADTGNYDEPDDFDHIKMRVMMVVFLT